MKRKVLVVDDERLVADTLCLIFQKRGYDCRTCYSGNDALRCVETFRPELLLCDITMPGMDGMEVAASIADKVPGCRVLLLTGYYINLKSAQLHTNFFNLPNQVMLKPVSPEELLRQANSLLQSSPYAIAH